VNATLLTGTDADTAAEGEPGTDPDPETQPIDD
jgi:hypothetical protein